MTEFLTVEDSLQLVAGNLQIKNTTIKTIGIDPGLSATGIGIVRGMGLKVEGYSYGSINTSKNISLPSRLNQIFSKLLIILKDEKPDLMVVEDIFSLQKYPKSGITLGKVTGVILLAGNQLDLPVIEVQVREAKQILTGNGSASKMQLERAVRHFLNLTTPIKPYHASDAIGLALIGLFRYQDCLKKLKQ
ncbi:MAG: crossover junction endodeoxyribonuclease RuvC [Desulfobacteraceae bacterium]|nr:crossover junction endodeoxyribonuclease RuvC [Desulfobacteraceae bacterium]